MTTRKNLGSLSFGLSFAGLFFVLFTGSASAATDQQIKSAPYTFQDAKTITATIDGKNYSFTDRDPSDPTAQFVLNGGGSAIGDLCKGNIELVGTKQSDITKQKASITATFNNFATMQSTSTVLCTNTIPTFTRSSMANPSLAYAWFNWVDKNTIALLGYNGNDNVTYTRGPGTNNEVFYAEGAATTPAAGSLDCRTQLVVSANNKEGHSFRSLPAGLAYGDSQPATAFTTDRMSGGCRIYFINEQKLNNSGLPTPGELAASTIKIGDLANADKEPAVATDTTDNSCEGQNNTGLEWLLCGVLRSVDSVVSKIDSTINNQLEFNVKDNLQDPAGIKQAWASIRNIATAILVILMLVMIISQALGGGLLDAYTIRKLLPRVIVAVILMQISWDLFIWVIQIVNDVGNGIRDLLAAPFGGYNNLRLDNLIGGLGVAAPGAALFLGLSAATLAVIINPFGVLMLAFVVLLAVFTALAVLLFRTVLVIACIIFAPLALAAWILPGTERYWKLWWSNFIKVLFLFPLIISMIVSGRIFAYIVAGKGGTPGLLDLFAIVIGYFGPYFILPRAFKWGGQLMSAAGGAISSNALTKGIREKGGAEIKGMGERYQGSRAKRYDPSASFANRTFRRVQSGSFLPTERSRRLTIAKGDKWKSERNDEASALVGRAYEMAMSNGYVDGEGKKWGAGVGAAKQALVDIAGNDGTTDADKRAAQAAHKQLLDTQSWIEIQNSHITKGANAGKRVFEMPTWESTLTTSPQHYSATIGRRPDLVPHMLQYTYTTGRARTLFADEFADIDENDQAANDAKANEIYAREGITRNARLSDSDRMIMAIKDQMGDNDFGAVAQGFYQEVNRLGDATAGGDPAQGARVAHALRSRLEQIESTGYPGQQILSHLSTGSLAEDVDRALAREGGPNARGIGSFIHPTTPAG